MSYQAVEWAMKKAPMLLTEKGKPDTTARHVLAVLAECAQADGSEARPSLMTLQYRTGYDRRTIQRALRRLESGLLILVTGTKYECTVYRMAMGKERPASDWAELEADEERQRGQDAERQRRSRAKRVTHSNDVTVTDANSVTDDLEGGDVTHADDVSHAFCVPTSRTQNPDVTHGTPPYPSFEPSGESSLSSTPPSDPQPSPATSERETEAAPDRPTAAQRAVRASGVVTATEEQAFIDWVRAKHPPAGAPFWNRVAENDDVPGLAVAWRADQPMRQSSESPPRATVNDTSGRDRECRNCDRPIKPDALEGLCRDCREDQQQAR